MKYKNFLELEKKISDKERFINITKNLEIVDEAIEYLLKQEDFNKRIDFIIEHYKKLIKYCPIDCYMMELLDNCKYDELVIDLIETFEPEDAGFISKVYDVLSGFNKVYTEYILYELCDNWKQKRTYVKDENFFEFLKSLKNVDDFKELEKIIEVANKKNYSFEVKEFTDLLSLLNLTKNKTVRDTIIKELENIKKCDKEFNNRRYGCLKIFAEHSNNNPNVAEYLCNLLYKANYSLQDISTDDELFDFLNRLLTINDLQRVKYIFEMSQSSHSLVSDFFDRLKEACIFNVEKLAMIVSAKGNPVNKEVYYEYTNLVLDAPSSKLELISDLFLPDIYGDDLEIAKFIFEASEEAAKFISQVAGLSGFKEKSMFKDKKETYKFISKEDTISIVNELKKEDNKEAYKNYKAAYRIIESGNFYKSKNPVQDIMKVLNDPEVYEEFYSAYEKDSTSALEGLEELNNMFKDLDIPTESYLYVPIKERPKKD